MKQWDLGKSVAHKVVSNQKLWTRSAIRFWVTQIINSVFLIFSPKYQHILLISGAPNHIGGASWCHTLQEVVVGTIAPMMAQQMTNWRRLSKAMVLCNASPTPQSFLVPYQTFVHPSIATNGLGQQKLPKSLIKNKIGCGAQMGKASMWSLALGSLGWLDTPPAWFGLQWSFPHTLFCLVLHEVLHVGPGPYM